MSQLRGIGEDSAVLFAELLFFGIGPGLVPSSRSSLVSDSDLFGRQNSVSVAIENGPDDLKFRIKGAELFLYCKLAATGHFDLDVSKCVQYRVLGTCRNVAMEH